MHKNDKSRLSFRAVEVFVAAIEEQSITKAAKRLGSSPSSVSLQLSNMEQILDARLIERSARRFQLTAAGEIFAPRARAILDEVTVAKVELSSAKHAPKMDIRIGAIEDFDNEILPSLLSKLRQSYPQSNFYINSGASHESHATLSSRGADIIIAADKTNAATPKPADAFKALIARLGKISEDDRKAMMPQVLAIKEKLSAGDAQQVLAKIEALDAELDEQAAADSGPLALWNEAKRTADDGINALANALKGFDNPALDRIAEHGITGLNGSDVYVRLTAALFDFERAGAETREKAATALLPAIDAYRSALHKDPMVAH